MSHNFKSFCVDMLLLFALLLVAAGAVPRIQTTATLRQCQPCIHTVEAVAEGLAPITSFVSQADRRVFITTQGIAYRVDSLKQTVFSQNKN